MRSDRELKENEIRLKLQFLDKLVDIQHLGIDVKKEVEKQWINISSQLECINLHSDK
ncbi:hypothetical protein ACN6MT_11290 [Neobacillus niacini]|uniref:hypothetical protein n=1 Tax=Neobacillus niacini TaxID=86668 RepID=UPI003B017AD6